MACMVAGVHGRRGHPWHAWWGVCMAGGGIRGRGCVHGMHGGGVCMACMVGVCAWQEGHPWQGVCAWHAWWGVCMAGGGIHGMHGGGCAWQQGASVAGGVCMACMVGGVHGRRGHPWHAWWGCVHGRRGHPWQGVCAWHAWWGGCMAGGGIRGMHGGGGVCMAGGGIRGRGCVHGREGASVVGGVRGRYYEIRSMSGRYASYWNAFLLSQVFAFEPPVNKDERFVPTLSFVGNGKFSILVTAVFMGVKGMVFLLKNFGGTRVQLPRQHKPTHFVY